MPQAAEGGVSYELYCSSLLLEVVHMLACQSEFEITAFQLTNQHSWYLDKVTWHRVNPDTGLLVTVKIMQCSTE